MRIKRKNWEKWMDLDLFLGRRGVEKITFSLNPKSTKKLKNLMFKENTTWQVFLNKIITQELNKQSKRFVKKKKYK